MELAKTTGGGISVVLRDVTLNFKIKGKARWHKGQFSFWEVLKVSESEEKNFQQNTCTFG